MNPFETEPLQIAHRSLVAMNHRYIDYDAFMAEHGRWTRHYLVLGNHRNSYDKCCRTALYDQRDFPYPEHLLVRPYLRTIIWMAGGEKRKVEHEELTRRESPLYFPGPSRGDFAMVDLVAAYHSIYSPTSFDLDYDGIHTPRSGSVRFVGSEELGRYKLLRNALLGTARAEWRTESDFGVIKKVAVGGRWRRPSLWAYVQDVLMAVAWEMRLFFGAVHIHTDGYVLPSGDLTEDAIEHLWKTWGLRAQVKAEGAGIVTGLGSWQIGDVLAGAPKEGLPDDPFDNMVPVENAPYLRAFHLECQAEHFVREKALTSSFA